MKMIDLRSDTVTQPTPAMRAAMLAAPLGDDVFGDDPTVNALQEKIAALLGFEAALFVPTGTQSNFCAVLSHCQRGDEYIVGQMAHAYRWEGGGAAVLGSVQPQPIAHAPDGTLPLPEIEANIKPDDAHFARTRLLCLENTIGGKLLPLEYVIAATDLARSKGLATHLDGARLFNAATAQSMNLRPNEPIAVVSTAQDAILFEARRIAENFDSVSVCFSKGLGAPVGSALCGSRELIKKAHRIRKMAGGGMRQAGILAAAAIYALDHQVERLQADHRLARMLGDALSQIEGVRVDPVHSNIIFVDLDGAAKANAEGLLPHLKNHGILATGLYRLRFVTHLDLNEADISHTIDVIRNYFKH
ncbi:GntG family PLP-dependent aldolase [Variovorax sp. PCZ-1]|uniref:GntG family PLP-dependent aldolase n=1 Tax=Variovorax sp. PCZ-1 TaxID=2835533 RepID=UPI001BCF04B1|nr:GntG family PLP-dependent aldolase [Variovorax sp. PCZ-1]MBS7806199.1 low-specificity L-threonine aldolase [Variovorax sp. PCZ-1]